MTVIELEELLDQIKFDKLGYTVYFEMQRNSFLTKIYLRTKCSRTGIELEVCYQQAFHFDSLAFLSKTQILERILDFFIELEIHEIKEAFKVNGEMVFDPHKEGIIS